MDSFNFPNVQSEKASAMPRYSLFTSIAKTLRILELCLALVLLSWILSRLPFALRISGHYVREFSVFVGSPLFVFIVSNTIIATLVAKSGRFAAQNSDGDSNADTELYEEFLKNSADRTRSPPEAEAPLRAAEAEVVYQDKEIVSEMNTAASKIQEQDEISMGTDLDSDSDGELDSDFPKVYRRSRSEKLKEESTKMIQPKLQRSESEKPAENRRENLYPQDKLSNEEFQRTIEAFIAKQMRFLREESVAIVIQNQS